jgi:hypothetical protein
MHTVRRKKKNSCAWWPTPVIPAFGRWRQEKSQIYGQSGLHSETMSHEKQNNRKRKRIFNLKKRKKVKNQ